MERTEQEKRYLSIVKKAALKMKEEGQVRGIYKIEILYKEIRKELKGVRINLEAAVMGGSQLIISLKGYEFLVKIFKSRIITDIRKAEKY